MGSAGGIRQRALGLLAGVVLAAAAPSAAAAAVASYFFRTFRSAACDGELRTELEGWMPDAEELGPEVYDERQISWRPRLSAGRALALAERALRDAAILGDSVLPWRISLLPVSRHSPPRSWDLFYAIAFAGRRCPDGKPSYATVLVAMDGRVILPSRTAGTPARGRRRESGPRGVFALLTTLGTELIGGRALVTRIEETYRNLRCTVSGCPGYDVDLKSISWAAGPPDVRLIAQHLSPRLAWFTHQDERPPFSPADAIERAAAALATLQVRGSGRLPGGYSPSLVLARPGGWIYVVEFLGWSSTDGDWPRRHRLSGEIVVLADGSVLLPTDGAILLIPRQPRDDHDYAVVKGIRGYRLPSTRRYNPPPGH